MEERPDNDETVPLALVPLFDDAVVWNALVEALGNLKVHLSAVPRSVGILDLLVVCKVDKDILEEVVGRCLLHAGTANPPVADDHDAPLVVLDADLVNKRVERFGALLKGLVIARHNHDQVLGMVRLDNTLRADHVAQLKAHKRDNHNAVEREREGNERQIDIIIFCPPPGCENEKSAVVS